MTEPSPTAEIKVDGWEGHSYPSAYPRHSGFWALDEAWNILDTIRPGILSPEVRFYLAGRISGAMMLAETKRGKPDAG